MKISLEDARQLLEASDAILIDHHVVRPKFAEPSNRHDPFLILEWRDEDAQTSRLEFDPDCNPKITINEDTMILTDNEGDRYELKLLEATNLELALR